MANIPDYLHKKIETKLFEGNGFFHGSYVYSKLLRNGPHSDIDMAVWMQHYHDFNEFMVKDCGCTPSIPLNRTYESVKYACPNGMRYDVMLGTIAWNYKQSDKSDLVYTKHGFQHKRYPQAPVGYLINNILSGKYCVYSPRPTKPDPPENQRPEWQCKIFEKYNSTWWPNKGMKGE